MTINLLEILWDLDYPRFLLLGLTLHRKSGKIVLGWWCKDPSDKGYSLFGFEYGREIRTRKFGCRVEICGMKWWWERGNKSG